MGNDVKQFYDPGDHCAYFYNDKKKIYQKVCDVGLFNDLPLYIQLQIKSEKAIAKHVLDLPEE